MANGLFNLQTGWSLDPEATRLLRSLARSAFLARRLARSPQSPAFAALFRCGREASGVKIELRRTYIQTLSAISRSGKSSRAAGAAIRLALPSLLARPLATAASLRSRTNSFAKSLRSSGRCRIQAILI